jgi:hypothetical protein
MVIPTGGEASICSLKVAGLKAQDKSMVLLARFGTVPLTLVSLDDTSFAGCKAKSVAQIL